MSLPKATVDRDPTDLQGKTRRHRRDPVPVGLPEDDPARTPASTPARSRRSTSASTSCRRCCPSKVDATLGAFWNVEGVQLRRAASAPARSSAVDQAGVPTYDELVLVGARARCARRRRCCAASCGARRGPRGARNGPAGRRRRAGRRTPDLDRATLTQASVKATLPAFFPADKRASRSAAQDLRAWSALRALDASTTSCCEAPPTSGRSATNEFLPGEGLEQDVGRPDGAVARSDPSDRRAERVRAGQPGPLAVRGEELAHLVLRPPARAGRPPDRSRPTSLR